MSDPQLSKNPAAQRYEIHLDGERIGFVAYRRDGDVVDLPHTEVNPLHGGQGHAARVVEFALRDIEESGLRVTPTCPYIARFIERRPEFQPLVA